MNCPYFKEQRVKFCSLSAYRKMILLDVADTENEVCSGPSYQRCPLLRKASARAACPAPVRPAVCPSLQESLVQYCSAAAFKKFVPASEPELLRCGRPAYRYCSLYRETVPLDPLADGSDLMPPGVCVPAHLGYARNHMWVDEISSGQCQIGIDGFLAGLVGSVEQIAFLTVGGVCRPTVVLRVRGVDLHLAFPARIAITAANLYLRAQPARLTADAYGAGWLFEGQPDETGELERHLARGAEATAWMKKESERLQGWLQGRVKLVSACGTFRDSKTPAAPWLEQLSREDLLSLFDEFVLADETNRR